jgi:hypothetical protein
MTLAVVSKPHLRPDSCVGPRIEMLINRGKMPLSLSVGFEITSGNRRQKSLYLSIDGLFNHHYEVLIYES